MPAKKAVSTKSTVRNRKAVRKKTPSKTSARPTMDSEVKKAFEAAKPLLKGLGSPTIAGCRTAHTTIEDLVLSEEPRDNISAVDEILFLLSVSLSVQSLRGYATLDADHINQINSLVKTIERYIKDSSQQRPLNFMMLASPGAGKSHFIKCVASRLASQSISAITFNMAGMQTNEDLVPALDAARNLKVEDRLPLLFLDEFDTSSDNYALLLPLLWDGSLNLGQRDLRLGKVVIVMAGSNPTIPEAMDHARSMRDEVPAGTGYSPKLVDLFSRVNGGVLRIPPFYDVAHKIDRRTDKVCVAIELLRKRFGRKLRQVPLGLLRFIATVEFRYGVRSIAHLVDLIPYQKDAEKLTLEELQLPLDSAPRLKASSLAYHLLHEDQAFGVVKDWQEAANAKVLMPIEADWLDMIMNMPGEMIQQFYLPMIMEHLGHRAKP